MSDENVQWVKLKAAAQIVGIEPRLLKQEALSGRAPIRMKPFGDRGLMHCVLSDVLKYKSTLET